MSIPRFVLIRAAEDVLNRIQDNIKKVLDAIANRPELDSQILTGVLLKSGQLNSVNHKLGRKLTGWKVIRQRGPAQLYDSQDDNDSPGLLLYLRTTADVVVDISVF